MEKTKFAPPQRSSPEEIRSAAATVLGSDTFISALNFFPEIVLILDKNRQVVFGNNEFMRLLGISDCAVIFGKRPGEVFNCIHASKEEAGCGTSEFCKECGAVNAILRSQKGQPESRECRITIKTPGGESSLDLRVWAIPVCFEGQFFTFFVIRNIGDEKRRQALERIFFHDILNDTTILQTYSENVIDGIVPPGENTMKTIHRFTKRLTDAILEQKDLLDAEEGRYELKIKTIVVSELLKELCTLFENQPIAKNRPIVLSLPHNPAPIKADLSLLWRILVNLTKNALEATPEGGTVTVGFKDDEIGMKIFFVNNPGMLTSEVYHQIFQRSFSTKGNGRGLGTYSIKFFTEKYLKGKGWFESNETAGTTFFIALPA